MFWKQLARIVVVLALFCVPLVAQQAQEPPTHVTLQGAVRTADGTPIPGASVHIVELTTGKSWVTWTDEQGKFRLPELPAGKFRVEATQIGFVIDTKEVEPTEEKSADIILSLRVATLAEIASTNATQNAGAPSGTTPTNPLAGTQVTANANPPAGTGTPPGTTPPKQGANNPPTQTAKNGQQNGRGGRNGGGFTDVNVGGQAGPDMGALGDTGTNQSALGGADSADAVLMNGTTARGDTSGINIFMGGAGDFGQNGQGLPVQGLNQPPGQQGFGDQNQFVLNGGGPGGPGGRGGGGPGGGGRGAGGPGGGGRGAGRGQQGQGQNGVPWGMQQLVRRRINTMHYTLNETFNDSAFNARTWSATGNVEPKPPFENNNFGGSLGGPFRIPKLYDGRDRTYFFINANFLHGTKGQTNESLVPTMDERSGNFCTAGITLYDYTSSFAGPRSVLPGTGPGNCSLQGAINPATSLPYINPASQGLLQFIPAPNLAAVGTSPTGQFYNYILQSTVPENNQRINFRVNQTITKKINFGVQYNLSQAQSPGVGIFQSLTSNTSSRGQQVQMTMNYNISQRLIDTVTANFTRSRTELLNGYAFNDPIESNLGITGVSTLPINYGLPSLGFTGGLSGLNDTNPSLRRNQTWMLTNALTYSLPKHTLHFGYTFRRYQINSVSPPTPRGSFTFTGAMSEDFTAAGTPVPNASAAAAAYSIADFLLGLPQSTHVQFGSALDCGLTCASNDYLRSWGMLGYATDDWHMLPSLTVTFGLRYELMLPPTELFGHLANLDVNPAFTQVSVVTPGQIAPFSGALPNSLIRPDYKDFAPAVAIAWRVPGKMFSGKHALTVRAGYRVADNSQVYLGTLSNSLLNEPPFGTALSIKSSPTQILTLQNGFPAQSATVATNTTAVDPNYHNLYVQTWSLSLESQIVEGLVWQLTYTGIKGTGLDLLSAPNVLSASNSNTGTIPNALGFTYDSSGASSIYHGLQARLLRRMKNGFTFTALYTFSKSIDNSSSIGGGASTVVQQFPLFSLERGLSTFDMRHQITGNSTYELPFGERKRWAKKGAEARILGNFRLSGSVTYHTGTPFTALVQGAVADFSGQQSFSTRADLIPGCNPNGGPHLLGEWFNTACFAVPSVLVPGTIFGDAGRDTIIGPSAIIVNMALARTMQLNRDGQHRLDLRWEVTNLGNAVNYAGFGTTVNSTSSFGKITGAGSMRTMDAVIRFNF